ncbi:MAG: putative toxin-antitoxin system toxin component, PIN family [Dechloromonas sp.]|nr:putative toxin-antitoxin system toxin component, PIN family [Candidatus Dechloromonas phosphoritropha]MBP8787178.1 putative toxin-antitoxin system toxin component, PIN family [Azonexus sp.]MBP9227106.1 putative toxin-antitoxin system toxin component, PIN family [Azonexus sp.]
MSVPRIVIDTNCLVSALIFSWGKLAWLRQSWQSGRIKPLVSRQTANELIRVLAYPKFKLDKKERETLLAEFLPYAETVNIATPPVGLPSIRDEADTMFLALAVVARADAVISGDGDILSVRHQFEKPPILTLAEFASWIEDI